MSDRHSSKPPLLALFHYAQLFGVIGALLGFGICFGISGGNQDPGILEFVFIGSLTGLGILGGFILGRLRGKKPEQDDFREHLSDTESAEFEEWCIQEFASRM